MFTPLEGSEHACAIVAIADGGFDPTDFVLEERCTSVRQPGGSQRVHKLISVKRLTVGFQRQYNSGPGGGWPYEFERDLRLLVFGHPILDRAGSTAEAGVEASQAKARKTSA